jgi:tetratricopeptide (TPR) repeat protein
VQPVVSELRRLRLGANLAVVATLIGSSSFASRSDLKSWNTYYERAKSAYSNKDYPQAEKNLDSAIAEARRLGPDYARLGKNLGQLGLLIAQYQPEQYLRAERLLKESLAMREKALWPEHPDVTQARQNLAELYIAHGQFAEADDLMTKCLAGLEKHYGSNNATLIDVLTELAEIKNKTNHPAEAENLYKRALALAETYTPRDKTVMQKPFEGMLEFYCGVGGWNQAEPLAKRYLAVLRKQYKPHDPALARALQGLGTIYFRMGRLKEAEQLTEESIDVRKGQPEQDLTPMIILATAQANTGRWKEAEAGYKRALSRADEVSRPRVLALLASAQIRNGKVAQAHDSMDDAMKLINHPGVDKAGVLLPLVDVARAYQGQQNWSEALNAYNNVAALAQSCHNENILTESVNGRADCYLWLRQYEKAEPLYLKTIESLKKSLGPDVPEVGMRYSALGDVYCCMHKYDAGIQCYLKAKDILANKPAQRAIYKSVLERLVRVYEAAGMPQKRDQAKKDLEQLAL